MSQRYLIRLVYMNNIVKYTPESSHFSQTGFTVSLMEWRSLARMSLYVIQIKQNSIPADPINPGLLLSDSTC